jgi:hypothetical protein
MTCASSRSPNDTLVSVSLLSMAATAADDADEEGSVTPRRATGGNDTAGGMVRVAPLVCVVVIVAVIWDEATLLDVVLMTVATADGVVAVLVEPFMVTGVMRRTLPT